MAFRQHREACRCCGEVLWYDVKEEPSGWKVFYACIDAEGCGREWYAGRIPRNRINHHDEVFAEAREMGSKI